MSERCQDALKNGGITYTKARAKNYLGMESIARAFEFLGPVPSKCSNSDLKNLSRSNFRSEIGCEILK